MRVPYPLHLQRSSICQTIRVQRTTSQNPVYTTQLVLLFCDSGDNHSEDEDYSISVSAVMQRRASTKAGQRKYKTSARRTSSPMGHAIMLSAMTPSNAPAAAAAASLRSSVDVASVSASVASRRRSSVFTTSSGE